MSIDCFYNSKINELDLVIELKHILIVHHKKLNLLLVLVYANPSENIEAILEELNDLVVSCKLRFLTVRLS